MPPSLRLEREMLRAGSVTVAGIDEVGRGAVAGPVTVGVVVVDLTTRSAPPGLRDSKLLSPAQREVLFPRLQRWGVARAVASSTPAEIDRWGLTAALRLAALRALVQVGPVDHVILDGSHDWLSDPAQALFDDPPWPSTAVPRVRRRIKADNVCSSVAAASVLAKVLRDREMSRLAGRDDRYGWRENKGYTTADHSAAIRRHGLCDQHRRTWNLAATLDLTPHSRDPRRVVPS